MNKAKNTNDSAQGHEKTFSRPPRPSKRTLPKILKALESIPDLRQEAKVQYSIPDIILLVLAAMTGTATTWREIEMYGKKHLRDLRRFLHITRIPSHDTIERVVGVINSGLLMDIYQTWCLATHTQKAPKDLKGFRLLNIDGKTMRGSGGRGKKQIHIESCWDPQAFVCRGQIAVDEKSNEITAIPKLLAPIDLHGYIVTSDAMGTQVGIARQIIKQGGNYLLALKGNQGTMLDDIELAATDEDYLKDLKKRGRDFYLKYPEKAHGQIEIREYWMDDKLHWLNRNTEWDGLKTVGFERTTIKKDGKTSVSWRFFLTSLAPDVTVFAAAARGHWSIESMHFILDTVFREDANQTIDRQAAYNLNIFRKWVYALNRQVDIGFKASVGLTAFALCCDPTPMLQLVTTA